MGATLGTRSHSAPLEPTSILGLDKSVCPVFGCGPHAHDILYHSAQDKKRIRRCSVYEEKENMCLSLFSCD